MHHNNFYEPDLNNSFKASYYLEKTFELSKPEEKPMWLYYILDECKSLFRGAESIKEYCKGEYQYLKGQYERFYHLSLEYKKPYPMRDIDLSIAFDDLDEIDDHTIIDHLLDDYSGISDLIFGLLLLEEEYNSTGEMALDLKSLAYSCFYDGVVNFKNTACSIILSLYYSKNIKGAEDNPQKKAKYLSMSRKQFYLIPKRFRELINLYLQQDGEIFKTTS